MEMEYKTLATQARVLDETQGIVETVFAIMGNVDNGRDRIHPGAFTKTISERGHKVKVLDLHNRQTIMAALAVPVELREIGRDMLPAKTIERYPEATGGAYARIQFLMNTPEGTGAFERIKAGAVDEWSFGYDAIQKEYTKDAAGETIRELKELRLHEISPVLWGMNEGTVTLSAKADTQDADSPAEVKPFANEHSCRIRQPGDFQADSFRRIQRGSRTGRDGKQLSIIIGRLTGETTTTTQAYRYPTETWTEAQARAHCKEEGGRFEAAKEPSEKDALRLGLEDLRRRLGVLEEKESLDERISSVRNAFDQQFRRSGETAPVVAREPRYWIREVHDTHVVVDSETNEDAFPYFRVTYSRDADGNVVFAPREQWVGGAYQFVEGAKAHNAPATGRAAGDSEPSNSEAGPDAPPTSERIKALRVELYRAMLEVEDNEQQGDGG